MAKDLSAQSGVSNSDPAYLNGKIVNFQTLVGAGINQDMVQFFQFLMNAAGLAANGDNDNETNGYQFIQALLKYVNDGWLTKVIPIGDWDMSATNTVTLNHGLSDYKKIMPIGGVIISDDDAFGAVLGSYDLATGLSAADSEQSAYIGKITSTTISITKKTGGLFDTADFNTTPFNRGYIRIAYLP